MSVKRENPLLLFLLNTILWHFELAGVDQGAEVSLNYSFIHLKLNPFLKDPEFIKILTPKLL